MLIFFCNVIMVSLLYVHAKRTGWKIRPWPETVILKIKMIQMILCCLEQTPAKIAYCGIFLQITAVTMQF